MAKALTIGAGYSPNFKLGVDQEGKPVMKPCVLFYFNCDSRTANLVKGSGEVKNVYVDTPATPICHQSDRLWNPRQAVNQTLHRTWFRPGSMFPYGNKGVAPILIRLNIICSPIVIRCIIG